MCVSKQTTATAAHTVPKWEKTIYSSSSVKASSTGGCSCGSFVEFTGWNQTTALWVHHDQMDFPVFGRPWGDFCTYCRVDVFFVRVLLSLSIIVSVSCPFFFLASLSCLTILLVIDTHTHTQRPYKDTKGMHTYTGNVMLRRNLMGCRYSVKGSVWDRDYDFKPLMCGHADYNIFFFF